MAKVRVKILSAMAGSGFAWKRGTVVEMDQAEAARHAKEGAVEVLEAVEEPTRAPASKPETATRPPRSSRKGG